jgi:hypothetical protein
MVRSDLADQTAKAKGVYPKRQTLVEDDNQEQRKLLGQVPQKLYVVNIYSTLVVKWQTHDQIVQHENQKQQVQSSRHHSVGSRSRRCQRPISLG